MVLLVKLAVAQVVNNLLAIYETQDFIKLFT
jgi:hypothetical protein